MFAVGQKNDVSFTSEQGSSGQVAKVNIVRRPHRGALHTCEFVSRCNSMNIIVIVVLFWLVHVLSEQMVA